MPLCFVFSLVLTVAAIVICRIRGFSGMAGTSVFNLGADLVSMAVAAVLLYSMAQDREGFSDHTRTFALLITSTSFVLFTDICCWVVQGIKELEHLKKYLYIEKLRFGKKLNIEYDIQATDFELPQLTIQPLAENAVKHGLSKKKGGGTLTIATRETDNAFEVIVSDDGTGFDINEKKDDGRSHIGMENIKNRLNEMCNADVIIESEIGKGTVAKIIIPKGEAK